MGVGRVLAIGGGYIPPIILQEGGEVKSLRGTNILGIPESFNTNISLRFFFTTKLQNIEQKITNSKVILLLKKTFKSSFLRFLVLKNKTNSDLVRQIQLLRIFSSQNNSNFQPHKNINCIRKYINSLIREILKYIFMTSFSLYIFLHYL